MVSVRVSVLVTRVTVSVTSVNWVVSVIVMVSNEVTWHSSWLLLREHSECSFVQEVVVRMVVEIVVTAVSVVITVLVCVTGVRTVERMVEGGIVLVLVTGILLIRRSTTLRSRVFVLVRVTNEGSPGVIV